jgi:hypothetical protein
MVREPFKDAQEIKPQTLNSLISVDCAQAYGLILSEP